MKSKLLILLVSFTLSGFAQKKVTFILENPNSDEEIFLASNLGQWQAAKPLHKFDKHYQLVLIGTKISIWNQGAVQTYKRQLGSSRK